MLCSLRFTLHNHNCTPRHQENAIVMIADEPSNIGCICSVDIIYSSFEYLGCRDHDSDDCSIIIQTLTSVQDTYDILLYGERMTWENLIFLTQSSTLQHKNIFFPLDRMERLYVTSVIPAAPSSTPVALHPRSHTHTHTCKLVSHMSEEQHRAKISPRR